jgi:MoaD family protein
MAIFVEVPQIFRKHTNGSKVITVEGATIRELLQRLGHDYPGLRKELMSQDGQLHRFVNVYLNAEDIRFIQHLDTPLQDGDRLAILPAVAGGAPPGGLPAVAGGLPPGGLPRTGSPQ